MQYSNILTTPNTDSANLCLRRSADTLTHCGKPRATEALETSRKMQITVRHVCACVPDLLVKHLMVVKTDHNSVWHELLFLSASRDRCCGGTSRSGKLDQENRTMKPRWAKTTPKKRSCHCQKRVPRQPLLFTVVSESEMRWRQ